MIFNDNKKDYADIATLLLIALITYLLYEVTYKTESNILRVILLIIIFKYNYKETMYKTLIGTILTIGVLTAVDLFSSLIFSLFLTVNQMRGLWYFILLCNITMTFHKCLYNCNISSSNNRYFNLIFFL